MNFNDRIHWIDVLKGIGIFLVIMGHTFKENSVFYWVYSFHMPLFFLISGYLIEPKSEIRKRREFFLKKCKSLLLPFFVFRVLLVTYWIVVESHFRELDLGPIWFLIVLFFDEVLLIPILTKYRKLWQSLLCMVICGVTFFCLSKIDYSLYWQFSDFFVWILRILNAGIWFSGGFFLHKLVRPIPEKSIFIYPSILICMFLSLSLFRLNPDASMFCCLIGDWVLYIILGFAGIGMSFLISKYIVKQNKYIEWIGKYTIVILAIHEPIKRIILKVLEVVTNIDIKFIQINPYTAFIVCIIVLISCIPIIYIFKWIKNHTGKYGGFIFSFIE